MVFVSPEQAAAAVETIFFVTLTEYKNFPRLPAVKLKGDAILSPQMNEKLQNIQVFITPLMLSTRFHPEATCYSLPASHM